MSTLAVILAAGAGSRLGGVAKAALSLADGRSWLAAIVDSGRAGGVRDWLVVIGPPHDQATGNLATRLGLPVVENPAPQRGMGSSVAIGFARARQSEHEVALLWPVDHPLVTVQTVRAVIDHASGAASVGAASVGAASAGADVVIPTYRGRGGHPSAFARSTWDALARCADAPEGARSVIRAMRATDRVYRLATDDRGVIADIDTPQALAALTNERRTLRSEET